MNPYWYHLDNFLWAVSFPEIFSLAIYKIKDTKEVSILQQKNFLFFFSIRVYLSWGETYLWVILYHGTSRETLHDFFNEMKDLFAVFRWPLMGYGSNRVALWIDIFVLFTGCTKPLHYTLPLLSWSSYLCMTLIWF